MTTKPSQQWHLLIQVEHGPEFGHRIVMQQKLRGHEPGLRETIGSWTGLGIPEQVMRQASSIIVAMMEEHLITRYGVAGELPFTWAGEPDPL